MTETAITSRDNARFKTLRELAHDSRARRHAGQTILEGQHLIEEALASGVEPHLWLLGNDAERPPQISASARVVRLPAVLLKELASSVHPAGPMAIIDIPKRLYPNPRFILLVEAVQDPGNLGALLRTAAAAGVDNLYLSTGCAEAWSPKALRGGQGAQFRLAIVENADLVDVVKQFKKPVYVSTLKTQSSLFNLDLQGSCGFAVGNEGAGVSSALLAICQPFIIPMPGGVESLNVAAATAIALFERVRQHQEKG